MGDGQMEAKLLFNIFIVLIVYPLKLSAQIFIQDEWLYRLFVK